MRIPFLASFLLFVVWFSLTLSHNKKREKELEQDFWATEEKANHTRKKPLDDLNYIHIPIDQLPTHLLTDNDAVAECIDILNHLSTQKIVNLTGISNTDLKLTYGTANITPLSEYDQNYTLLARTLQKWADLLFENGNTEESKSILEFAVSTNTDVSGSYRLLASIYKEEGRIDKIHELIAVVDTLHSPLKGSIVRTLQEFCQSTD